LYPLFLSLLFHFLPATFDIIKIMSATIPTTSNTPVHTPALNISPMAWQLHKPAHRRTIATDTGKIFAFILFGFEPCHRQAMFVIR